MSVFDKIKDRLTAKYSEWIKVEDDKSGWTIEDFSYETGVDEQLTKPHCWKCVAVNKCWFANEKGKKPDVFNNVGQTSIEWITSEDGLYHPRCHCEEIAIEPIAEYIKFIIPVGKIDWLVNDKAHLLSVMGYKVTDVNEVLEIIKKLTAEQYVAGNYEKKVFDEKGFRIGIVIDKFPGKGEKRGKLYKVKSGWTIFPNGKLKSNTLIGGLV